MMTKALGGKRGKRAQRMGYVSLILGAVHLVALGFKGWLKPKAWPAGMPSISLLAFVAAVIPLVIRRKLIYERQKRETEAS